AGIVGYRRRKEGDRTFLAFIGQDLAEGDARMIVDGDVDELPADASAIGLAGAITGDAVTDPLKSSELLDIDMDHLAGTIAFVAPDGLGRFEGPQTRQPRPFQHPADGGW